MVILKNQIRKNKCKRVRPLVSDAQNSSIMSEVGSSPTSCLGQTGSCEKTQLEELNEFMEDRGFEFEGLTYKWELWNKEHSCLLERISHAYAWSLYEIGKNKGRTNRDKEVLEKIRSRLHYIDCGKCGHQSYGLFVHEEDINEIEKELKQFLLEKKQEVGKK